MRLGFKWGPGQVVSILKVFSINLMQVSDIKGLELYYLHACRHPQMANAYMYNVISGWDSAYDEIGIKFSGKVDLIKTKKKE